MSCFDGAVRLYWPNFDRNDAPNDHPLFLPEKLQGYGARGRSIGDHLFGVLRRIAALRHSPGDIASEVRRSARREREEEVESLRNQIQEQTLSEDELLDELETALDESDRLRQELDQVRSREQELRSEVERLRQNLAAVYQYEEEEELVEQTGEAVPDEFDSVLDALVEAERIHSHRLNVWEPALESADESEFARPHEVFDAVEAIAELGDEYFRSQDSGGSVGPWSDWFEERGITQYAPQESESTMNEFGQDRIFTHEGEQREIQRHVTLGGGDRVNCLQIYFEPDLDTEQMEIAYCGVHLPYSSQTT